jgi:DNA-binding transcriptional LysR family regulator
MSVTPSAVSQQLRILEREAGVALVEHEGRRIRLTEAGLMLVRHADTITAAITEAESALAASRDEVGGSLRVAAFPTAARAILPSIIATLGARHPALRVTLRDLETEESLTALRMDEVDLAVVDEYDESTRVQETSLDLLPLLRDPIFLALPADRWAGDGPVPLVELRNDAWIMDTEASSIHQVALRACRGAGFDPHVRSICRDYSVIIALVEAGLGVAVLPGLALQDRPIRARIVAAVPSLERTVLAAVKPARRRHPAVAALLAELRAFGRAASG